MFPAMGRQGFAALLGEKGDDGLAAAGCEDAADAGDGDAGDRARNSGSEGGGEEQLVVLAAMERLGHGRGGMNGKRGKFDLGGDSGLPAEAGEVGGEAVAEVECGRGETAALQPQSLGDARLGVEVGREQGSNLGRDGRWARRAFAAGGEGVQAGEAGGCSAKSAGDVEGMAGNRAGAQESSTAGNGADEHDVGDGEGGFGQIAAGKGSFIRPGKGEEAVEEALKPGGPGADGGGELAR